MADSRSRGYAACCSACRSSPSATSARAPSISCPARRRPRLLLRAARTEIQIGRSLCGKLPVDVRLLLEFVVRVGGVDRGVERLLERGEVLLRDRLLERLPVLAEVLIDGVFVLRPHEGAHLEQADDLLVLELRHRP